MKFAKVHGCGNDAVLIDAIDDAQLARRFNPARGEPLAAEVRAICARTTGIGADVVIVLTRAGAQDHPDGYARSIDCAMLVFNSDGGTAEMCSTGVRAAAKHLLVRRRVLKDAYHIATGAGVLEVRVTAQGARVRMGKPIFDLRTVPADRAELGVTTQDAIEIDLPDSMRRIIPTPCGGSCITRMSVASMGNPHAVFWLDGVGVGDVPLAMVGPALERHPAFPQRTNVHMVEVRSRSHVQMRSWERGAGATLACGTGACAVVAAGVSGGRLERRVLVDVPGGRFTIEWDPADDQMVLEGPIEEICRGEWGGEPPADESEVPVIITERLLLRAGKLRDAPRIAALANHREIAELTLTVPFPYAEQDAVEWLERKGERVRDGRELCWLITLRERGDDFGVIGCLGLHIDPTHKWAELGYWMGMEFWGRGYATEAARAALAHGFDRLGLARIQAHHMINNPASGRVLDKIGMEREGLLKSKVERFGVRRDVVAFGLTREAWSSRRGC